MSESSGDYKRELWDASKVDKQLDYWAQAERKISSSVNPELSEFEHLNLLVDSQLKRMYYESRQIMYAISDVRDRLNSQLRAMRERAQEISVEHGDENNIEDTELPVG